MAVDKNLFLYNLAVVTIMYNEGHYIKEWLDYHLLAGVDHFYIYDHESTDNFKEILQPYIDKNLVTYKYFPGEVAQLAAFTDAVDNYKFFCRYMAFIDCDEFILPKSKPNIVEVLDEILSNNPNASAVAVNWNCFGSNGQTVAEYNRGVLERFTRRAPNDWFVADADKPLIGNIHVKTIANPRRIKLFDNPHFARYFGNYHAVNEDGKPVPMFSNLPVTTEKIVINHYYTKSQEEYVSKIKKGRVDTTLHTLDMGIFERYDRNEEFDDSILRYRNSRRDAICPAGRGVLENLAASKQIDLNRVFNALITKLLPTFSTNTPTPFIEDNLENFLICLAVASRFSNEIFESFAAKIFEEGAVNAIYKTLHTGITLEDVQLLIGELPRILALPYPIVKNMREPLIQMVMQVMNVYRLNGLWAEFAEVNHTLKLLQSINNLEAV